METLYTIFETLFVNLKLFHRKKLTTITSFTFMRKRMICNSFLHKHPILLSCFIFLHGIEGSSRQHAILIFLLILCVVCLASSKSRLHDYRDFASSLDCDTHYTQNLVNVCLVELFKLSIL